MKTFRTLAALILVAAAPFAIQAQETKTADAPKADAPKVESAKPSTADKPTTGAAAASSETKKAKATASKKETTTAGKKKSSASKKKTTVKAANNANCPVGGGAVGSMQAGSSVTYNGYKVGLCCDGCKATFMKDPETYLKKALGQ